MKNSIQDILTCCKVLEDSIILTTLKKEENQHLKDSLNYILKTSNITTEDIINFEEYRVMKLQKSREDLVELMSNINNEDGTPYFNTEFIKSKILTTNI